MKRPKRLTRAQKIALSKQKEKEEKENQRKQTDGNNKQSSKTFTE